MALFFNPNLTIDDNIVEVILKSSKFNKSELRHIRSLVANIVLNTNCYIPLNNRFWPKLSERYNPQKLNYNGLLKAVETLEAKKIISKSWAPGMRATKLDTLCDLDLYKAGVKFCYNRELIVLRSEFREPLPYEDTNRLSMQRRALKKINDLNASFDIELGNSKLETDLTRLYKIDFNSGGRFFAPYQFIEKDKRKYITINKEKTVEIDYQSMHIYLAFHLLGQVAPVGDFYNHPFIQRDIVKLATLISLNAKSFKEAIFALSKKTGLSDLDSENILRSITANSPYFNEIFYSGIALKLQKLESDTIFDIMKYATKKKLPHLVVHDSFIVREKEQEIVRAMMIDIPKKLNDLNLYL
jgi:hypothetical protein